jgi:hypothetical protein
MIQLIHMTASYSNAMLVAVLPHVSDFAKKLELPVSQPITTNQVIWSHPSPLKGFIADAIVLTNRYWFSYSWGYVNGFRSLDDNPFFDEDPAKNWPRYAFGKDNMTTNEAIELARSSLLKLGYNPQLFNADQPPSSLTGPFDLKDGNHAPYCEIRWEEKVKSAAEETNRNDLAFQINLQKKTVVGMSINSRKIWRPDPKIDVAPELESDYRQRIQGKMFVRTNAPAQYQRP